MAQVKRRFDEVYRAEPDPWGIGDADAPRYSHYHESLLQHAKGRTSILDIGCGLGAFLHRFRSDFAELVGLELSEEAIDRGRGLRPEIQFVQGSASRLDEAPIDGRTFDCVVYSDVICYLRDVEKDASLAWIRDHLEPGGVALIAAWCPGGEYLTPDELEQMVRRHFVVLSADLLETQHLMLIVRPRRRIACVTLDYETWHPVPVGRTIDWEVDVFEPTSRFMDLADRTGVVLTLMVETGEYLWLRENDPGVADRMVEQWQAAARRGHDVQLHLHPGWLPELGTTRAGGEWSFDMSVIRLHDYPGDLTAAIARCVEALHEAISPIDPTYSVSCFRAGAYAAQPFDRLYDALLANGIWCDTSVHPGGVSAERGYDYRRSYSTHQPYFASRLDPQLLAPPAEFGLVELPIFAPEPGVRWMLDGDDASQLSTQLVKHGLPRRERSTEAERAIERLRWLIRGSYARAGRARPLVNRLAPRPLTDLLVEYPRPRDVEDDYFVMIGHTKGPKDWRRIEQAFTELNELDVEFVSLSSAAASARSDLLAGVTPVEDEPARQVEIEAPTVLGSDRNTGQSQHLQRMVPGDRDRVLDLGCGAGSWTADLAKQLPWAHVTGLDFGEPFVVAAARRAGVDGSSFVRGEFGALPFGDAAFDAVYADNVLEHAVSPTYLLREIKRVLSSRGVLVAAIPSDALAPEASCVNHIWKTEPADVRARLLEAGFERIEIEHLDVRRRFGSTPYPPSGDRMIYVRAWAAGHDHPIDRVRDVMTWLYEHLSPEVCNASTDPVEILRSGNAWCEGYAIALQHLLDREGFRTRRVDFSIRWHPRGRGDDSADQHSVLEVSMGGRWQAVDPTCNVLYEGSSIADLTREPRIADRAIEGRADERFIERGYETYCGAFAYERAFDLRYHLPRPARRGLDLLGSVAPAASDRILASPWVRGIRRRSRR